MAPIWNLFVADRDVQIVLNGHDHDYERFARLGTAGPDPAGLREFDVTMQLATVTTHNPFPTPIGRVRLSRANGTVVFDGPIPVGDITRTITGNVRVDQFNIYATDG
jgi:hypothetical protein